MYELDIRFQPHQFEASYLHAMMRRVAEASPYAAIARGGAEKSADGRARVYVEVRSPYGHFSGEAVADDLREASDAAEAKVQRGLEEWRRNRFRDQNLDTYRSVA